MRKLEALAVQREFANHRARVANLDCARREGSGRARSSRRRLVRIVDGLLRRFGDVVQRRLDEGSCLTIVFTGGLTFRDSIHWRISPFAARAVYGSDYGSGS